MLGFMILTVSDVERSLAFYEAALKPLNIKFFLPYRATAVNPISGDSAMASKRTFGFSKGSPIRRPFTGGSRPKATARSMSSTRLRSPLARGTIFRRGCALNTTPDTMPPMYWTRTGIRLKSSIRVTKDGVGGAGIGPHS